MQGASLSFLLLLAAVLGQQPQVDEPKVTIVTVRTDGLPWVQSVGHFPHDVVNIGLGKEWGGQDGTKVKLLSEWASTRPKDELLAFLDGDVFWGGCSMQEFVQAYYHISAQSGKRVVFGAEITCWEQDCRAVPEVPSWANAPADVWGAFERCHGFWTDKCASIRQCRQCDNPPAIKFLNSGFLMGPAGDIARVTRQCWTSYKMWTTTGGDQSVYAKYWLEVPHLITLDYATQLVISLSDLDASILKVDSKTGKVKNMAFNRTQCFIHPNGGGKALGRKIITEMGTNPDNITSPGLSTLLDKSPSARVMRKVTKSSLQTEGDSAEKRDAVQGLRAELARTRTSEQAKRLWWVT